MLIFTFFTDLSFVEGPIVDPDEPQPEQKPPKSGSTDSVPAPQTPTGVRPQYPQDPSALFNHHFGSFFNNDFFTNPFAGFGDFSFPRYTPWWKG